MFAGLGDCCKVEVLINGGFADPDGDGTADTLPIADGVDKLGLLPTCVAEGRDGLQDGARGEGAFILG